MSQEALFEGAENKPAKKTPALCELTTREISRYVKYYTTRIRLHSVQDTRGVFKAVQRILEAKPGREAISPQDIADAIKNYEADEFVKSQDQRQRKHIRSFFTYENILVWRKPIQKAQQLGRHNHAAAAIAEVEERFRPAPLAAPRVEEEVDEEVSF